MTITHIDSHAATSGAGSSHSTGMATGVAAGRLAIVTMVCPAVSRGDILAPAGLTQIDDFNEGGPVAVLVMAIRQYYKVLDGTETGWTFNSAFSLTRWFSDVTIYDIDRDFDVDAQWHSPGHNAVSGEDWQQSTGTGVIPIVRLHAINTAHGPYLSGDVMIRHQTAVFRFKTVGNSHNGDQPFWLTSFIAGAFLTDTIQVATGYNTDLSGGITDPGAEEADGAEAAEDSWVEDSSGAQYVFQQRLVLKFGEQEAFDEDWTILHASAGHTTDTDLRTALDVEAITGLDTAFPDLNGLPGSPGPAGTSGATGPTGPSGAMGSFGEQGGQGPRGPKGPSGASGPTGPSGSAGAGGSYDFEVAMGG